MSSKSSMSEGHNMQQEEEGQPKTNMRTPMEWKKRKKEQEKEGELTGQLVEQ